MGFGDELMAAGHAQRVYDADPSRRVALCDRAGDVRWHELWDGNPILARPDEVAAGESVHRIKNGVGCRPYIEYPFTVDQPCRFTDWRAADHVGRLYLRADERALGEALHARLGDYVVIEPSPKAGNVNKRWSFDRFASVVAACPDVRWVQLLHQDSIQLPVPGVEVLDIQSFRATCGVLASATAFVGTEGGLHHASAVLGVRAVVIFGGFVSPRTTGYPLHVNLADEGPGSPCGCWRPCPHCRAAMSRISVEQVIDSLRSILAPTQIGVSTV